MLGSAHVVLHGFGFPRQLRMHNCDVMMLQSVPVNLPAARVIVDLPHHQIEGLFLQLIELVLHGGRGHRLAQATLGEHGRVHQGTCGRQVPGIEVLGLRIQRIREFQDELRAA
eukprot:3117322-Pyramimonas_sp.AAC.1